jgi:hypothetical protein
MASTIDGMKPHPEMIEGLEAFDRFKRAVQAVLKVKKSDMPPSPFGKSGRKRKPKTK